MKKSLHKYIQAILALLAGFVLLFIPLLRDLHIESALLVALIGCFWAAISACKKIPGKSDVKRLQFITTCIYITGLPLLIYAIVVGCLSIHGVGFWILYPLPSILLGYSLGRLLRIRNVPFRRIVAAGMLLFIALGVLLIEFFNLPQVYFFNHVWGGWPGPIYDETVTVSRSLLIFRGMTLVWAALFWWIPNWGQSRKAMGIVTGSMLLLIIGYSQLPELGIISPRTHLQDQLGAKKETPHFVLYYNKDYYSTDEMGFIAQRHEFYYQNITSQLEIERPADAPKIESYLYAHPWQKKKLVGAKFTSYVPVWLNQDQLHIAKPQIEGSLKHELVHVLAKQFGNQLFNASWSIGLIEGLAVAVAKGESPVSTIDQIVVSQKPYPSAQAMRSALSPSGFYGGRSAVNYTQSGSFVQYLLNNHPVERFKKAYRTGDFEESYQSSFSRLIAGWHYTLDTVEVDSTDKQYAERLYGLPSLFEQQCPHVQSVFATQWDRYRFYLAERDTSRALTHLSKALQTSSDNPFVKSRWSYLQLKAGNAAKVRQQSSLQDTVAQTLMIGADAFAMGKDQQKGDKFLEKAQRVMSPKADTLLKMALNIRQNTQQWSWYRQITYQNKWVSDSLFTKLHPRTQAQIMQQAVESEMGLKLNSYAAIAMSQPLHPALFKTYEQITRWLAYHGQFKVAKRWLLEIDALELRPKQRLKYQGLVEWVGFLEEVKHGG